MPQPTPSTARFVSWRDRALAHEREVCERRGAAALHTQPGRQQDRGDEPESQRRWGLQPSRSPWVTEDQQAVSHAASSAPPGQSTGTGVRAGSSRPSRGAARAGTAPGHSHPEDRGRRCVIDDHTGHDRPESGTDAEADREHADGPHAGGGRPHVADDPVSERKTPPATPWSTRPATSASGSPSAQCTDPGAEGGHRPGEQPAAADADRPSARSPASRRTRTRGTP